MRRRGGMRRSCANTIWDSTKFDGLPKQMGHPSCWRPCNTNGLGSVWDGCQLKNKIIIKTRWPKGVQLGKSGTCQRTASKHEAALCYQHTRNGQFQLARAARAGGKAARPRPRRRVPVAPRRRAGEVPTLGFGRLGEGGSTQPTAFRLETGRRAMASGRRGGSRSHMLARVVQLADLPHAA
jgi:hypothetical protein